MNIIHAIIRPSYLAIRGTFYGISAAVGKLGAAVGTQVLIPLRDSFEGDTGIRVMFWVCGAIGFLGAALCIALVPDYSSYSLEYEDRAFRTYLAEKQWETEFGFRDWDKVMERLERLYERKMRAAAHSGRSNLLARAWTTNSWLLFDNLDARLFISLSINCSQHPQVAWRLPSLASAHHFASKYIICTNSHNALE